MTLDEAGREFAVRYYRWALSEALREEQMGFPLLTRVGGTRTSEYLAFMTSLSSADRKEFASGMVKRAHEDGMSLAGDQMSAAERDLTDRYVTSLREHSLASVPPPARHNPRKFWNALKRELDRVSCGTFESMGGQTARYRKILTPDWTIVTFVGGGARPYYWHNVWARDCAPLVESIAVSFWLGIGQRTWEGIEPGAESEVARHMAMVCAHFLDAAPGLLEGLSNDVREGIQLSPSPSLGPRLAPKR